MYISTPGVAFASRQSTMQTQAQLSTIQKELASTTLADAGLTLGARSGQLIDLRSQQDRLDSLTDSNTLTSARLSSTTSTLNALRTTATSFLSTLSTASSGGTTVALGTTAQTSLSGLTAALNTAVGGQYIFGGIKGDQTPMTTYTDTPASANKQAVDSAFQTAFGFAQTSTDAAALDATSIQTFLDGPFSALFGSTAYGATWSSASDTVVSSQIAPGQTVDSSVSANALPFRQLAQAYTLVKEFGGGNLSSSATAAVISTASTLINKALDNLSSTQASVGVTQSAISAANDSMAAQKTLLASQTTALDGVDTYALTTQLSGLQTQLQASYELTNQLKQMSLVNYLT